MGFDTANCRGPENAGGDRIRRIGCASVLSGDDLSAGHELRVTVLVTTPDSRCAISASRDRTLKVWELEAGQVLASVALDAAPTAVAIAPDGLRILAGDKVGNIYCLRYTDPDGATSV